MTDARGLPLLFDPLQYSADMWPSVRWYGAERDMIYAHRDAKATYVRSSNKAGKDFTAGFLCVTHFVAPWLYYPVDYFRFVARHGKGHSRRIVTTSIAGDHLRVLWAEIAWFLTNARVPLLSTDGGPLYLTQMNVRFVDELHLKDPPSYLIGMVCDKPEKLAGHHADYNAMFGDEGSGLENYVKEQAQGWAKREFYWGNPNPTENFYKTQQAKGDIPNPQPPIPSDPTPRWFQRVLKITAKDSPNVQAGIEGRLDDPAFVPYPGVLSYAEYLERLATWDKIRRCVGLEAEFYEGSEQRLVTREWLDDARAYALCRPSSHGTVKYLGCLPDGELIETKNGLSEIQTIKVGDWVYDADGNLTPVKRVYRRKYDGNVFEILPSMTTRTTRFTSEHPVLVLRDTKLRRNTANKRYRKSEVVWKEAKDVVAGDVLRVPIRYREEMSEIELMSKFPVGRICRGYKQFDQAAVLEEDFWFLTGLWLAEGWLSKGQPGFPDSRTISIALNSKTEMPLAQRVTAIAKKLFGRKVNIRDRSKEKSAQNTLMLSFWCRGFADFLETNFGQKADGKFISEWVKRLPQRLKVALCAGYTTGDGCVRSEKSGPVIEWVSVSEKLLLDLQDVLLSLGHMSALTVVRKGGPAVICGRVCVQKRTYHLRMSARDAGELLPKMGMGQGRSKFMRDRHTGYGWIDGDYLYLKVRSVTRSDFGGHVNNLETGTHTYCSRFITVHNCDPAEGGDDTAWCVIDRHGVLELVSIKTPDTNVVFGKTIELMRRWDVADYNVCFDRGAGQAHVDRLRAAGYPGVRSVGFGNIKNEPKRGIRVFGEKRGTVEAQGEFVMRRSQMYWEIRELLERPLTEAGAADDPIVLDALRRTASIPKPDKPRFALPEAICGELVRQLACVPLTYDELGRFKLIPKTNPDDPDDPKTLKYLLGRSPDQADAFALAVFSMRNKPQRQTAGPS